MYIALRWNESKKSTWSGCGGTGATRRNRSPIGNKSGCHKSMKEELQSVLPVFRRKKLNTDVFKIINLNINERSTREDVRIWLRSKGFSDRILQIFNGYDGARMFQLEIGELEFNCGCADGRRLNAQTTLSRHLANYFNTQPGELRHILEKARRKIEDPK